MLRFDVVRNERPNLLRAPGAHHRRVVDRLRNRVPDKRGALDLDHDESPLLIDAEKIQATCGPEVELLRDDHKTAIDQGGIPSNPSLEILLESHGGGGEPSWCRVVDRPRSERHQAGASPS